MNMKLLSIITFALLLVPASCERFHFRAGTVEIEDARGVRTYHSAFTNGELGKIGKGYLFRAQLPDGGTIEIESSKPVEEHK